MNRLGIISFISVSSALLTGVIAFRFAPQDVITKFERATSSVKIETQQSPIDSNDNEPTTTLRQPKTEDPSVQNSPIKFDMQNLEKVFPPELVQQRLWKARKPEYDELLRTWSLTPDLIAKVESIIQKRELQNAKLRSEYLSKPVGSEEGRRAHAEMERQKSNIKEELDQLIGIEKSDELELWESAKNERKHIKQISQLLSDYGHPLNPEQESLIFDAMYQAKQALGKSRTSRVERLGSSFPNEVLRHTKDRLSPEQSTQLQQYLSDISERRR